MTAAAKIMQFTARDLIVEKLSTFIPIIEALGSYKLRQELASIVKQQLDLIDYLPSKRLLALLQGGANGPPLR